MPARITATNGHATLDPRLKISALWVSILFVVAYIDIFAFYRTDQHAEIESGTVAGFDVNQGFLIFTTMNIVVPSLMVYLSLVRAPRLNRNVNIGVAAFYAITIIGAAAGEWAYYLIASVIELLLLATVVFHARSLHPKVSSSWVTATRDQPETTQRSV